MGPFYPNKNDWDEKFWAKNYRIFVTAQGIEFLVNANNEQDAIDYIIDDCAENHPGLLWSNVEVAALEKKGCLNDYICGGNEGRYLSTFNVRFEEVKR